MNNSISSGGFGHEKDFWSMDPPPNVYQKSSNCARFEKNADFLSYVVTIKETWECLYDPEIMQESMEHSGSSKPKNFSV